MIYVHVEAARNIRIVMEGSTLSPLELLKK